MELILNNEKYWEFIRKLRNHPIIQEGFIETVNITPEQQKGYMSKYNDNYYICIKNNVPVGYVGEINNDLRYAVDPDYQGKGIATFMVNKFMKIKPKCYAKVKHLNVSSHKVLLKCGFTQIDEDINFKYYIKDDPKIY